MGHSMEMVQEGSEESLTVCPVQQGAGEEPGKIAALLIDLISQHFESFEFASVRFSRPLSSALYLELNGIRSWGKRNE